MTRAMKPPTPAEERAYRRGAEAAASWADDYNGSTTHAYRLGDCVLGKMNLRPGKPRLNRRKIDHPDHALVRGVALALSHLRYVHIDGAVAQVAKECGITIELCKRAGVAPYDWKELKRAGVPLR